MKCCSKFRLTDQGQSLVKQLAKAHHVPKTNFDRRCCPWVGGLAAAGAVPWLATDCDTCGTKTGLCSTRKRVGR